MNKGKILLAIVIILAISAGFYFVTGGDLFQGSIKLNKGGKVVETEKSKDSKVEDKKKTEQRKPEQKKTEEKKPEEKKPEEKKPEPTPAPVPAPTSETTQGPTNDLSTESSTETTPGPDTNPNPVFARVELVNHVASGNFYNDNMDIVNRVEIMYVPDGAIYYQFYYLRGTQNVTDYSTCEKLTGMEFLQTAESYVASRNTPVAYEQRVDTKISADNPVASSLNHIYLGSVEGDWFALYGEEFRSLITAYSNSLLDRVYYESCILDPMKSNVVGEKLYFDKCVDAINSSYIDGNSVYDGELSDGYNTMYFRGGDKAGWHHYRVLAKNEYGTTVADSGVQSFYVPEESQIDGHELDIRDITNSVWYRPYVSDWSNGACTSYSSEANGLDE